MMDAKRGEDAWKIYEAVKANERQRKLLLAQNAALLNEIWDKKYYKEILGDEEGEWAGFLADIEIYYSRNEVNTLAHLYRRLTKELAISPEIWIDIPITRLSDVLTLLTASNYADWFASAITLTPSDWKKELYKFKHGHEMDDETKHVHDQVPYNICRICGNKKKIHAETERS